MPTPTLRRRSAERRSFGIALSVALVVALCGFIAPSSASADPFAETAADPGADPGARPDVISGGVLWQREMQRRYALDRAERDADRLLAAGLDPDELGALRCAIYLNEPLTPERIASFAQAGIEVIPSTYTPPIEGRHPFGVCLARVEHHAFASLRADTGVTRVVSASRTLEPLNNVSGVVTGAASVRLGEGVSTNTGAGVRVAVADTGIDLTHPDFPVPFEAYDITDGDFLEDWGTDVANHVSSHGTHVAGSAVGRGTASAGVYAGSAPGAELCFYKVGDDNSGGATLFDIAQSVYRAAEIGCDIYSLSFGGLSDFVDGSEYLEQVFDYAASQGVLCFTSAGNSADDDLHVTVECPAKGDSGVIRFMVNNKGYEEPFEFLEFFQINWIDSAPGDYNCSLEYLPQDETAENYQIYADTSFRGTELNVFEFDFIVPPDETRVYEFVIHNNSDEPITAQLYANIGLDAYFLDADPGYTVGSPACADTAIAVGSINHRTEYTNYQGLKYNWVFSVGAPMAVSNYSSRGPRIDGVMKPEIVAPGAMMISCRDSAPGLASTDYLIIDNDGQNLDGSGPAQYIINAGTSMACPTAAGAAALLVEAHPYLSTQALRAAILKNASRADTPDHDWGYGVISAKRAVQLGPDTGVFGDIDGDFDVDLHDLDILISQFGSDDDLADFNNDGVVDTADLGAMIRNLSN